MISCSQCGTKNRDGSKFCGNCGARLVPQSGLVCPMCGTANKLESVFCSSCGARLVPLIAPQAESKPPPPATPIKGLSLPAKPYDPSAEVVEEQKPDEPVEAEDNWLVRLREKQSDEEPPVEEEDVPDWLKPSASVDETIEPVAPEDKPTWLSSLADEATPPSEFPIESRRDELPDWLKLPASPAKPPVATEPPAPAVSFEPSKAEEPPAPTVSFEPSVEEPPAPSTPFEPSVVEEPLIPSTPGAEEPFIESEPLVPATSEEIPAWVSEMQPLAPAEPKEITSLAELAAELETTPGEPLIEALEEKIISEPPKVSAPATGVDGVEEIPDWLRGEEPAPKAQPALAEIQAAMPDQMPSWIAALKPTEPPAMTEEEPLETVGPLAGLRGVLPLALAIAEPHASVKLPPSQVQKDSAAIFEGLLAAPVSATTTGKPARRTWSMRPLIYLLLALAVLVPFFLPSDWASTAVQISNTPTSELFDTIQSVPANSTVLLAFEYDPSVAGEMNLQAKAIVRHLIQRNIKIITLSTFETGAPLARKIVDDAARGHNYAPGVNYAHLGFLAGRDAGLVNLATGGLTSPTLGVQNLRDVKLVIVFAGTDDALKVWMEQVQPRTNVKIVAGVSAAVEPRARAYRDTPTRQLNAFTSGLVGAAQYEVLSKPEETGLALISINAQTAAQLLLVFVIGLGNLVYWFTRGQKRNG